MRGGWARHDFLAGAVPGVHCHEANIRGGSIKARSASERLSAMPRLRFLMLRQQCQRRGKPGEIGPKSPKLGVNLKRLVVLQNASRALVFSALLEIR
jgi:hypothetical protein